MRIVSMDDTIAERIQKQVNSVSSLIEDPVVSQTKITRKRPNVTWSIVCMAARFSAAASPIAHRPICWNRTSKSKRPLSRVSHQAHRGIIFLGSGGFKLSLCIEKS